MCHPVPERDPLDRDIIARGTSHSRTGDLKMKINYYPDTDSLYIDLSSKSSSDSIEISEGVVVDYDKKDK